MTVLLGLLEAAALFAVIIAVAAIIGKTEGKLFDNDPR